MNLHTEYQIVKRDGTPIAVEYDYSDSGIECEVYRTYLTMREGKPHTMTTLLMFLYPENYPDYIDE